MSNKITYRNSPDELTATEDTAAVRARRFEIDLAAMFKLLLKRRRLVIGTVGAVGLLTAVIMLMTPNRYKSEATILPSGKSDNFSALRAMAGMAGGLDFGDDNSSTLFPVILRSNLVVDAVLAKEYAFTFDGEPLSMTMGEYIGKEKPEMARRALLGMTTISTNTRTGEISLTVETEYPELSRAAVTEFLTQLERYNLHSRRSEATERVRYLSREVADREAALRAAEDSLANYQNRNRNWAATSSPTLLRDLARLKRDTEARAQTYAYLLQEYEIAKLDAQKDVPVVRILDQASLPTVKSGPKRTFTVLGASAAAFMFIVIVIFGVDLARQVRHQTPTPARQELRSLVAESFPRARRIYNRVRGHQAERTPISVDK